MFLVSFFVNYLPSTAVVPPLLVLCVLAGLMTSASKQMLGLDLVFYAFTEGIYLLYRRLFPPYILCSFRGIWIGDVSM